MQWQGLHGNTCAFQREQPKSLSIVMTPTLRAHTCGGATGRGMTHVQLSGALMRAPGHTCHFVDGHAWYVVLDWK